MDIFTKFTKILILIQLKSITYKNIYYFCIKHITMMTRIIFSILLYALFPLSIYGQTVTLINPIGDGGFETGTTFATNGWIEAQPGNTRQWQVGMVAGVQNGNNSAYVGNAGNYNGTNSNSVQHFYRDVDIPSGATSIVLSFYLKMPTVDYNNTTPYLYDYLKVYTTSTANTPISGTVPSSGYTQIFGYEKPALASFTQQSVTLPNSLAGTTVRLVFTFNSDGINPTANPAIDNISLTYTPANDTGITNVTTPTCLGTQNVVGTIKNLGTTNLTSATINWSVNGTSQTPINWTGNLATNATTNVTLGTYNFSSGTNYTITAVASQPNGVTDNNSSNNSFTTTSFQTNNGSTDVDITNSNSAICKNTVQTLTATGGVINNYVIFSENFNSGIGTFTETNTSTGGTPANAKWTNRPNGYQYTYPLYPTTTFTSNDSSPFMLSNSASQGSGTTATTLVSPSFSLIGVTNPKLNFYQFFKNWDGTDFGRVEISVNGGAYVTLATYGSSSDVGTESAFAFTNIDLSSYTGQSNLRIRFRYNAIFSWFWAIDNVSVTANKQEITWTASPSSPNTIFTDLACTTPYVSGAFATTVYVKPNATTTYTASSSYGSCSKSDNVIYSIETAVWNGSSWSPAQSSNRSIEFQGNYTSSGNLSACSCTVTSGNVNISSGNSMTLVDEITVNGGTITFESNSNLLQTNSAASNTGNIIVKRKAKLKRLEYNYWSSPVVAQQLKTFSPNTLSNRFYTYNESTDYFANEDWNNNFAVAKGYAIRAPNDYTTYHTDDWAFTGTPNNGTKTIAITKNGNGYNLVGNPYPSNISFSAFHSANSTIINPIAYFWTNANINPPMQGTSYSSNNYATRNLTGGTPASGSSVTPTDEIVVGQGFIVQKINSGSSSLTFNNNMRRTTTGNFFNLRTASSKEESPKYWLKLTTPVQNFNTLLVGYVNGATNGIDLGYDAEPISEASDLFYSIENNKNLIIQGRDGNFSVNDIVPLGANFFEAGNYEISISQVEGIFNGSQNIYLKDKELNTIVNLSDGPYKFTANAGKNTNRFEVIYKPDSTLGIDNSSKNQETLIYESNGNIFIENKVNKITEIQIFDAGGRLLNSSKPNDNKFSIEKSKFDKGLLIFKINLKNKTITKKFLLK